MLPSDNNQPAIKQNLSLWNNLPSKRSREIEITETRNKRVRQEKKITLLSEISLDILENYIFKTFLQEENYFVKIFSDTLSSLACVSKVWNETIKRIREKNSEPIKKFGFRGNDKNRDSTNYTEYKKNVDDVGSEDLVIRFDTSQTSLTVQEVVDELFKKCKSVQHMLVTNSGLNNDLIDFLTFSNLKTLDISHFTLLEKLPEGLTQLTWLDINMTKIRELPNDMTLLRWLNCSDTQICNLPERISNLKYLRCQGCKEFRISKALVGLEHLDVAYTNISKLPDNMRKLRQLMIYSTKIKNLPLGMISLKILNISFCKKFDGKIPIDIPTDVWIEHLGVNINRVSDKRAI